MRISGMGEFESIRKALQKDSARKPAADAYSAGDAAPASSDEIQISDQAKMLGKLRKIPDIRQAEIERVLSKMENGSLMTPEAIKESVAQLLENMISGDA